MNKILILSIVCLAVSADQSFGYIFGCSQVECSEDFGSCRNDQVCYKVIQQCVQKCKDSEDRGVCQQQCLFSSNSIQAQSYASCGTLNKCFKQSLCHEATNETNDCPATCFTPVKAALDACPNDAGYPDLACAQAKLTADHPECADKRCVCDLTLQLGLYIAGCQC